VHDRHLITNNGTAAPNGQWQDGLVVRSSAIATGGDAFGVRSTGTSANDIAAIHADGSALFTAEIVTGHIYNKGATPTAISCGTTPVITANSTDRRGSVTVGAGAPTQCTVNWHHCLATGKRRALAQFPHAMDADPDSQARASTANHSTRGADGSSSGSESDCKLGSR
jgi:hypothetical protein